MMIGSYQTTSIISFEELNAETFKTKENAYNDPINLLTLLGSCLKYYKVDDIHKILRKQIKSFEKEEEMKIIEKYNLDLENDEACKNHPDFDQISDEYSQISITNNYGYSQTHYKFNEYMKVLSHIYTKSELEALAIVYQTTNNPLIFIRKFEETGKTGIVLIAFDGKKEYLEEIDISLVFDLYDNDSPFKEKLVQILNNTLDHLANLEVKPGDYLIEYEKDDEDNSSLCNVL